MRNKLSFLAAACVLFATPAMTLDEVTVRALGVPQDKRESIEKSLRSASQVAGVLDDESSDEEEEVLSAQDIMGLAQSDYARMISVMYRDGYLGPSVSIRVDGREAADIDPFTPPSSVSRVDIVVDAGPQFLFGRTSVAPRAPNPPPGPIVTGFQTGEVANTDLVGSAANTAVSEWREAGHAKATVAGQEIIADHNDRRLDVDVDLDAGPKLRFGALTIDGKTDVSEKRLRQIMGFPSGEVYSPEEIRDAVNRLRRTGVFSVVTLTEEETPNADGTLDYEVTLIDEKKRRFGFGAEYATLDGISVNAFFLHRNLFGGAERLRLDGDIRNIGGREAGFSDRGGVDLEFNVRLTRPGTFGADNDAFVFGNLTRTDDPEYFEDEVSFGVGASRYFSDDLYGEIAGGLRYSQVEDAFGDSEYYHFILPSRLEWDKRDEPGDAREGFFLDVTATPYAGIAGSSSGARGTLDGRTYYSVGEKRNLIFAGRLQLGTVVGSDIDDTPPDFLFFAGGGDTVRGWPYQSLGFLLPNGRQVGGRSFVGFQGEVRGYVSGSLGLVGFYDAGFIGPDSFVSNEGEWIAGAGVGVRYATPIGPVRVDLATPVMGSGRDPFESVELYIGVGQAF